NRQIYCTKLVYTEYARGLHSNDCYMIKTLENPDLKLSGSINDRISRSNSRFKYMILLNRLCQRLYVDNKLKHLTSDDIVDYEYFSFNQDERLSYLAEIIEDLYSE
ncbi:MAG: hypothetical protein MHMPM18_003773, partial [Marteilia pararefringens]